MGKITLNIPDAVLDELRSAAEKNVRTLTDEIVWRCMALNHTSMALDHTRLVQLVIKTGLEAIERMVPDHTSMAANHTSMAPDHIPSPAQKPTVDEAIGAVDVQVAWSDAFPNEPELDEVTARKWLKFVNFEFPIIWDAFDRAKTKGSTGKRLVGYISAICEDKQGYRAKATKQATTPGAQPTKAYGDTAGWAPRPPTKEELDEDEEAKRIAIAQGWWSPDDA